MTGLPASPHPARAVHLVIAFLALVLHAGPALAQYRFDVWTSDDGLPQNIIRGIHQTTDGYLWIATLDGLARFDGVRFTVFNRGNSPGMESGRFTSLHAVPQGDLWMGTEFGSVTRYTRDRFITYTASHGLERGAVQGFTSDASGRLWVLSDETIMRWEPERERFVEIEAPEVTVGYRRLSWGDRGGFWGLDGSTLFRFVGGRWESHLVPPPFSTDTVFAAEEQDGTIWLLIPEGPRHDASKIGRIGKDGRFETLPSWSRAGARSPGPLRVVWRGTASGKPWTFEMGGGAGLQLSLTLPSSRSRKTVRFEVAFEDREGNLWLGTEGDGLYRARKQLVTVYSQAQGMVGRNVYPVLQDRSGAVWIGAWLPGGLSRLLDGKLTNYTSHDGLANGGVTALHEDREGRLWVATQGGLQTFKEGRFTPVDVGYDVFRAGGQVQVIHQDEAGTMWLGTGRGLIRLADGQATLLTTRDGLATDDVRVIVGSRTPGDLWIAGYGGLTRWRNGRLTAWTEAEGLPGTTVRSLYEDSEGVLWIGTYDAGLARFHDGRFTHYTTRVGLFNDGVFRILDDGAGSLWMSSNRGIHRVSKQELDDFANGRRAEITSIAYGKSDGMLNAECNGGLWPAGMRAQDGTLWFPTQDGVAVIDPAEVAANPNPPTVVIESLLIDRKPVEAASRDHPLSIRHGAGTVEIQYTGPSFLNAERVRFKYRLAGLEEAWTDAGPRRAAYYAYVPPGRYTFEVIAANSDGVWSTKSASLALVVLPPFYRTWWFLALASGSALALVAGAWRRRVRQLKRAHAAQQAFSRQLIQSQEAERKRIAAELHDGLGQRLVIIRNLALLVNTGAREADRESIDEIAAEASEALSEVREIARNLRPHQLDRLGLTKALNGLVRRAAAASPTRLTAEIDDLDDLFPKDREIDVYRVVQESLNNILKHARATEASLAIRRSPTHVAMTVQDNGCGFPDGFAPAMDGFGLAGLAERVTLLGGQLDIRSVPGCGTTLDMLFPVTRPAPLPASMRQPVGATSGEGCHAQ